MLAISIYLLSFSFEAADSETLKLLGANHSHTASENQRLERKM
jgi:hypothetical protein